MVQNYIAGRAWVQSWAPPKAVVVPIVEECYENALERRDSKVAVKVCLVPYNSKTINEIHGIPAIDDVIFEACIEN